ncbi:branched-chain amino acid ABC transporter permease [Marinivivus vitaminiproducens]|uniref:branched-chain amino acid ABC transporter permease n=1 Tax=Marinivivus vitaminiproducens TaxID=3035935 RepID=UPI0027A6E377|nr:branched-chain amino acid ABC transporter permease [Geminicoccaceae bacterium SCSIO 64248]
MAARSAPSPFRDWTRRATWVDWFLLGLRVLVVAVVGYGFVSGMANPRYGQAEWFSFIVFGLSIGSIYALIALGYTMVYGILRMVNFAHGDVFMFGSYSACFALIASDRGGLLDANPALAIAIAVLACVTVSGGIAVLAERIAYRPFRKGRSLAPLISTLGLSFALAYSARGMFGAQNKAFPSIPSIDGIVTIAGFAVPKVQLFVILAAVATMIVLTLIVMKTKIGTAMRAVSEDQDAATLMGINVNRVIVFTFALGGALAGIAGLLYGLVFAQISFMMGFFLGVKGFGAAVLGGIGNIPGAMLGGLALGMVESLGPALFLEGLGIEAPYQLRDAIAYTMLVMVLIFRPSGLLGERLSKRA